LKRTEIVLIAFSVLALLSTSSLIVSTLNYTEFYVAVKDLKLSSLEVSPQVRGERLIFNTTIIIENPTGYVGLGLKSLGYRLSYKIGDNVIELAAGQRWYSRSKPLQPHSDLVLKFSPSLNLEDENAEKYLTYTSEKDVLWIINCSALLETFTGDLRISLSYP
jgi:hypothetical protein